MDIIATNETNNTALTMSDAMHNQLDKFFAEKTIVDVDRNTYLNLNLHDGRYKIVISLIFMRDFDGLEINSYSDVIIEGKGAVLIFPPYWLSIPKELCIPYFEFIINAFYAETVSEWVNNGLVGGGSSGTTMPGGNTGSNQQGGCNPNNPPLCPCNIL